MTNIDTSYTPRKIVGHTRNVTPEKTTLQIKYEQGACNWYGGHGTFGIHNGELVVGVVGYYANNDDCTDPEKMPVRELSLIIPSNAPTKIKYVAN